MLPHEQFLTYFVFLSLILGGVILDLYFIAKLKAGPMNNLSVSVPWGLSEILMIIFLYLSYEFALWRLEGSIL